MTQTIERRYADGVTLDGRKLTGVAMKYGAGGVKNGQRERFEPGSLIPKGDVILNAHHDRARPLARTGGGGLELRDSAASLAIEATLPNTRDADDTIALVEAGILRGLSVEFRALSERREAGVRVIEKAELFGVAVVDTGAYPDATVAARSADEDTAPSPWLY